MYALSFVYCISSALSKKPKQLPNFIKKAETSLVHMFDKGVLFPVHTLCDC